MKSFQKQVSVTEKVATGVIWFFVGITIVAQLIFNESVLLLLSVLTVCASIFSVLVFAPETYNFTEKFFLIIKGNGRKTICIPYDSIVKFDTVGSFRLSKIEFDTVEVILTYKQNESKRKKTISCHPRNVQEFVRILQDACPHLEYEPF